MHVASNWIAQSSRLSLFVIARVVIGHCESVFFAKMETLNSPKVTYLSDVLRVPSYTGTWSQIRKNNILFNIFNNPVRPCEKLTGTSVTRRPFFVFTPLFLHWPLLKKNMTHPALMCLTVCNNVWTFCFSRLCGTSLQH